MFVLSFALVTGGILYLAATKGPRKALWIGWFLTMTMAPSWLVKPIGSVVFDLRTAAAMAIIAGFFIFPGEKLRFRWLLIDTLMTMLVASIIISSLLAWEIRPLTIPELTRRWLPPYLMGRLFLQSITDVDRVVPVAAKVMLILSLYVATESVIKFNPVNKVLGKSYAVLEAGEGYRWGIKRAQGPLGHPIFFGMMTVMLLPWGMEVGRRARHKQGPKWWLLVPFASFGSVFCTASRGPIIAAMFTVYITLFFRRPKLRIPMFLLVAIGIVSVVYGKDLLMQTLSKAAGETEEHSRIIINGEEVEYTGTKHRLLLYSVYADAVRQAGLFGYGMRMRNVPIEDHLAQRFSSIDNHYLLFLLQHGWGGMGCFAAVSLCVLAYLGTAAWNPKLPQAGLAGAMFGGFFAVTLLMQTVWFAPDYATLWLFSAGLAGSLRCLPRTVEESASPQPAPVQTAAVPSPILPRRLVPGHAPLPDAPGNYGEEA